MEAVLYPVLIDGSWRPARSSASFTACDPSSGEPLPDRYPVSAWGDLAEALAAGARASEQLLQVSAARIAVFLVRYAERLEQHQRSIVALAQRETALGTSPRLADIEFPRMCDQLRQAAGAARDGSWCQPTIDTASNIRSCYAALEGPVVVFGPNNFPLAFNGISGGDFAAAIAAGNPVIAKAHSAHPGTTRLMAEQALAAARDTGLPAATVQLLYRCSHSDGERLVSHALVGGTGYTGSRRAGLRLKRAADLAGKPIYLELSSVNPVFLLPGALAERSAAIAAELRDFCLLGTGQFCTNPGIAVLQAGPQAEAFLDTLAASLQAAPVGTLLGRGVLQELQAAVATLLDAGAQLLVGGAPLAGPGFRFQNTLLRVSVRRFLESPTTFQTEMFGNACLAVVAEQPSELAALARSLEGNLTGCLYSHSQGLDDPLHDTIAPLLRRRVGRLLNDKMPPGVAVVASMNHGGPYPATGHPGLSAVGLPASMLRFAALHCFDQVRQHRLPAVLRDRNADSRPWRWVDGVYTREHLGS